MLKGVKLTKFFTINSKFTKNQVLRPNQAQYCIKFRIICKPSQWDGKDRLLVPVHVLSKPQVSYMDSPHLVNKQVWNLLRYFQISTIYICFYECIEKSVHSPLSNVKISFHSLRKLLASWIKVTQSQQIARNIFAHFSNCTDDK